MRPFGKRRYSAEADAPPAGGYPAPDEASAPPEPPGPRPGFGRTFDAFRVPTFRDLWLGTLLSMAAVQMNIIAQPWLAYEISGSGLALGLVSAVRAIPMLVFSPVGGVVADRFDKRNVLIASQITLGILASVNAVLVFLDAVQVWHLVVLGFIQGSTFPFNMPTRQAYIPQTVAPRQLANALALDSIGMNVNRVLAPSVAGILIAVDPALAFGTIGLFYLAAVLTLVRLPAAKPVASPASPIAELRAGFRYVGRNQALLTLIVMAFIPVMFGLPFQQLLPVFQQDVLQVGPSRLGLMYTAVGIGSLAGSLGAAYVSDSPRKGLIQLVSGLVFSISLLLFALSTVYSTSLTLLAMVGLSSQGYMTINRVLLMLHTDEAYYGRVMSIYFMTFSIFPAAALPMGALVDVIGAPLTVAGSAGLLTLLLAAIGVLKPELWKRDSELARAGSAGAAPP